MEVKRDECKRLVSDLMNTVKGIELRKNETQQGKKKLLNEFVKDIERQLVSNKDITVIYSIGR